MSESDTLKYSHNPFLLMQPKNKVINDSQQSHISNLLDFFNDLLLPFDVIQFRFPLIHIIPAGTFILLDVPEEIKVGYQISVPTEQFTVSLPVFHFD